jgi:hypothetical protein
MDVKGYRNGESPYEEAQCGGPLGRAHLQGAIWNLSKVTGTKGLSIKA